MFKPARMTRVLMGGHQGRLEEVIEVLHWEKLVHLEDYVDPSGITTIGTPLEAGDEASDLLVRVRGLQKALGTSGKGAKAMAGDARAAVQDAEKVLQPALEKLAERRAEVARLDGEVSALAKAAPLAIDLDMLHGLRSVRGYFGTIRADLELAAEHELVQDGDTVALFVAVSDREAAERALAAAGFSPVQVPADAKGPATTALADWTRAHQKALVEQTKAQAAVDDLREQWAPRLASMERHLAAKVDKTQAPLKMAVTGTTFHIEGWIPHESANRVQNALAARVGDAVYFESLGDAPRTDVAAAHGQAGHHHHQHEGHGHDDHSHVEVDASDEAPVHLQNKGLAKPYEFMLGLLGRPRYWEVDPTKLMLIFFPLFFGFMVGDVLVGLAIVFFGLYLKKNHIFGIGGPAVGKALVMGGVMAIAFGLVVFGEGLGIHFVVDDHAIDEGELSWEAIIYGTHLVDNHTVLSGHFPEEGFIHRTGHAATASGSGADLAHAAPAYNGSFQVMAEGEEAGGSPFTFKPHGETHLSVNGWFNLGYYSKIHDVVPLLMWSVVIGVSHLVLGLMIGARNITKHHGVKLAIQEKVSWLLILAATGGIGYHFAASPGISWLLPASVGLFVASVALLWQGVAHTVGVGFIAILEVPSLFGNILSYTRLAAIGASKAGMAIAFSAIGAIVGGGLLTPAWWIVYVLGMVAITLLAILSGGLQSLRLQFVEFFQKFYAGGGRPYVPFGRRAP